MKQLTDTQFNRLIDSYTSYSTDRWDAQQWRRTQELVDRRFKDLPDFARQAAYLLRGLGFVLLRENEDASDLMNEPHFLDWLEWAITEGPLKESLAGVDLCNCHKEPE